MAAPSRIYLDWNATAPLRECAREAMAAAMEAPLGNPSSPHAEGRRAHALLDTARAQVAALVGAAPEQVVFTSGGTEAANAMMRGVARSGARGPAARVLATTTDHACVLATLDALGGAGYDARRIPVDRDGRMDEGTLADLLREPTACVVTHWANNETGVLQDLDTIGGRCRDAGVPLLVDAVQAAGKVPVAMSDCPASALSVSAHKIGGPQGIGALVLDPALSWRPLIHGGHQEYDRRAGTEPVLGAVGFGAAAAAAAGEEVRDYATRVGPLRERLIAELRERVPGLVEIGVRVPRIANTLSVRFPGWSGETLVQRLDLEGIAIGSGAACAAGATEPSHVLVAMELPPREAGEVVRFSLGLSTPAEEIARVGEVIGRLAEEWGAA